MGVLRIKENVDELLERDPYELFTLEEPHRIARRMRPEFWGAAFVGVLVAFAVALMTFLNVQRQAREGGESPYAYFEIKAIDPDGRPVAGAVVKEGERQLGITDSFGEWRRFMRVKLGSTVSIELVKKAGDGSLAAVKNIAVPAKLPDSGDLELTGRVQLARGTIKGVPATRQKLKGVEQDGSEHAAAAFAEPVAAVVADATVAPATADAALEAAPTSIWFMAEGSAVRPELNDVVQSLRRRSLELGMRVDPSSPLRVRVRDVLVARQTGERAERRLIVVDGRRVSADTGEAGDRLFSYLRDYQDDAMKTARDILWAATMHLAVPHRVTRSGELWMLDGARPQLWALGEGRTLIDAAGISHAVVVAPNGGMTLAPSAAAPCATSACAVSTPGFPRAAPLAGWQKREMTVLGADAATDIYVSGYAAQRLGERTYSYWAAPGVGANVTALRAGRLVYRGRVEPTGVRTLSLPSSPLSRATRP